MPFAENLHDNIALGVYQETVRPALGSVRFPRGAFLIGDNRPRQAKLLRRRLHVINIETNVEFAVVYSDNVEAVWVILAVPPLHHSEVPDAVNAGIFPEVDKYNMATVA